MLILLFIWFSGMVWARKFGNGKIIATDSAQISPPANNYIPDHTVSHLIDSISKTFRCQIKIKEAKISTTLNVRPTLLSMFGKRENRKYIIRVNNNPKFTGIYNHEVPFPARDGLWVHELMHIKDYQSRSTIGIIKRGWQYLSVSNRKSFEHEIDMMVVNEGYGEALYEWAKFIMFDSWASESYKAYKMAVYLTPIQIQSEMRSSPYMTDYPH